MGTQETLFLMWVSPHGDGVRCDLRQITLITCLKPDPITNDLTALSPVLEETNAVNVNLQTTTKLID